MAYISCLRVEWINSKSYHRIQFQLSFSHFFKVFCGVFCHDDLQSLACRIPLINKYLDIHTYYLAFNLIEMN